MRECGCFISGADALLNRQVALDVSRKAMAPRCVVDFSRPPVPLQGSPRDLWIDVTRPKPFLFARRQLDRDFAVFLMRITYDIVDDLDIFPMNEFQKLFFEIRQREWSKYLPDNPIVRQGELTDPGYFDFISYAQLLTVTQVMQAPRGIFVEASRSDQGGRVVCRNTFELPTSNSIYNHFASRLGNVLYDKLRDPDDLTVKPSGLYDSDRDLLFTGIERLVNVLHSAGYCAAKPILREAQHGHGFDAEFPGPAIMWGSKALHQRKAVPTDYDVYAMEALLRSAGHPAGDIRTMWTKSSMIRQIQLA